MDLGEIGGEGVQEVEKDQWADLVDDNRSSDSEQSEDEQELAGPQSDSDDQSERELRRPQKTRQRKQNCTMQHNPPCNCESLCYLTMIDCQYQIKTMHSSFYGHRSKW